MITTFTTNVNFSSITLGRLKRRIQERLHKRNQGNNDSNIEGKGFLIT